MAIVMHMEWPGATLEDYDRAMESTRLDETPPAGGLVHVAGVDDGTLRIVDVWESEEAWNAFRSDRLMPALEQTGNAREGPAGRAALRGAQRLRSRARRGRAHG